MIEEMKLARQEYAVALTNNIGVARAKERMMNMAFNYYDELLQAAEENIALKEENAMLSASLDEADAQLNAMKTAKNKKAKNGE